jgi:hypothetical protein
MAENENSSRDDFAAAFDAVEPTPEPAPAPVEVIATPEPIGESAEAKEARVRDEKGRFAPKIGDKAPEPTPKVVEAPKVEAKVTPPAEPTPTPEPVKADIPPPRSLAAPLREAWKKLDATEREYLLKREGETARVHSESQQYRQVAEKYKEIVTPYEPLFRAEGVDTMQGINNLMRATAVLATGAPQAKADLIANLIQRYGVDIQQLDARLSGQAMPQAQQPTYSPEMIAQQAQEAVRRELQQYQQQAAQKTAAQQLEAFQATEPEFFEDLKEDMGKLLETGFAKDYNDAYSKAQLLNPVVARIIEQRRAAASSSGVHRAQAAASSVRGQPTAGGPAPSGGSTSDDVARAWAAVEGRR